MKIYKIILHEQINRPITVHFALSQQNDHWHEYHK